MTGPIQGAGQLQTFKLPELGLKKDAEKLLDKETVATEDGQVEALVFENEEDALKYAGKDSGDEAVLKLPDGRWAVLDLKSAYHQVSKLDPTLTAKDDAGQLKIKAEALFEPGSEVQFPDRLMSRTRGYTVGEGYKETGMDKIEVVSPGSGEAGKVKSALDLAKIAVAGKVSGFNRSLVGNTIKGEQYTANLATTVSALNDSIGILEARYAAMEKVVKQKLEDQEKGLHGDGIVDPWIDETIKEFQALGAQLEELKTLRGILNTRLLISPESNSPIPGMLDGDKPVKIGSRRNDFGGVKEALLQRKGQLQDAMKKALAPETKAALQSQIDLIDQEYATTSKVEREVSAAALAIRMRTGALATTSKALSDASASLTSKTARLAALNAELLNLTSDPVSGPEGPRQKVDSIRKELETLKKEIESEKAALIKTMEAEAKVFKQNGPHAKEAQEFLQSQIDEVKALDLSDPVKAKAEAEKLNAIQAKMLPVLKAKANIWEGISPAEGKMLEEIDTKVNTYISDYKAAKKEAASLEKRVELAEKLPAFAYTRKAIESVSDARDKWSAGTSGQSGVDANKIINETYNHLDGQFDKYLGEPRLANWMTFGKFASREAGTQIQNLEAALEALHTFKKIDLSTGNDERAVKALIKVMQSDQMVEQVIRMALEVSDDVSSASLGELLLTGLGGTAILKGAEFADKMIGALETLRGAMVKGNTRIYENIVAPFDVFMQAESRGENGIEALKKAGYNGPVAGKTFTTATTKDPQGYVIQAFTKYKEAKNILDKVTILQQEDPVGNKAEIDKLLAQRTDIVHQANLLIGMQEQLTILQDKDIFGDPMVKRLLGAMTGTMSLTDTHGKHALLPHDTPATANWADFPTRMGLKEVPAGTEGAIKARMPDGTTKHFVPTYPEGTISEYFHNGLEGTTAKELIDSPPRDISTIYTDARDGQVSVGDRLEDATIVISPAYWAGKKLYNLIF